MHVTIKPLERGEMGYFDPNTGEIAISSLITPERQRCTIIHEVLHVFEFMTNDELQFNHDQLARLAAWLATNWKDITMILDTVKSTSTKEKGHFI
jgi:Zn-dependent peptidase ImmA (M78 family)